MISSEAAHPNCMYKWMNYIIDPKANAEVAAVVRRGAGAEQGVRPTFKPLRSRRLRPDPNFCDDYHADDPEFWKRVYYWNTPVADCGDDRGDVCKDYNDWVSAWTEIKG